MDKMTRQRPTVKYRNASEWPAWTDSISYVPTAADDAENAAMNATWDDEGPDPDHPVWDEMAQEAIALDQLTRGVRMF